MVVKLIIVIVLGLGAFAASLVGALATSGNLNKAGIDMILGRSEKTTLSTAQEDALGPFARKLQERELAIKERERKLDEREEQLVQRQRDLDATLSEVNEIQDNIGDQMVTIDEERQVRVEKAAKLLAAMNPENAASDMETMAPEDAAEMLMLIKERTAGRILDAMDSRKRILVHQILQERKY